MPLIQDEVEDRALRVLFDHVQSNSSRLSVGEVATLIGDGITAIRAKLALRALESRNLVSGSHNAMSGSSYEINEAGYRTVEQQLGLADRPAGSDALAPASDRVVTSLDNQPPIAVIRAELSKFEEEFSQANDTGNLVGDSLQVARDEISDLTTSFGKNSARLSSLYIRAQSTLGWIGKEAAAALIGAAALALLGLIAKMLGLI